MTKSLESKFKRIGRNIKRAAFGAIAAGLIGAIAGCQITPVPTENEPPTGKITAVSSANEGTYVPIQMTGTDSNGDTLTYSITSPSYFSVDSSTGAGGGTLPEVDADSSITIIGTISDGVNDPVQVSYTITDKNVATTTTDTGGDTDPETPVVTDYLDVTGYLKKINSDGTYSPAGGIVNIFSSSSLEDLIGQAEADSSTGYFSFHSTTQKVSDLSQVVLRGAEKENGAWKSFVKTESFSAGDVALSESEPLVVDSLPSTSSEGYNPANFKSHVKETNYLYGGFARWANLKGIEILLDNPDSTKGSFSEEEQNLNYSGITTPYDSNGNYVLTTYTGGRLQTSDITIQKDSSSTSSTHYTYSSGHIYPEEGWIIIAPNKILSESGKTTLFYKDENKLNGIINGGLIELNTVNNSVLFHELGHSIIAPSGEATTLTNAYTIMVGSDLPSVPKSADRGEGEIVYEKAYSPRENLDNILGQSISATESVY